MSIQRLLTLMQRLRDPERGCPWDLEQSFETIAPYTVEEAYEVADAIERRDLDDLRDELGDLLFQVVFHSQLAREQNAFSFDDVVNAICDKMERRHPHVFGDASVANAAEQTIAWEEHKRRERNQAGAQGSVLDDVPKNLPALTRAAKLGKRAGQVGFEWPDVTGALDKIEEEVGELRSAIESGADEAATAGELGDLLFSVTNVCRHLGVNPEEALRGTNAKFARRFRYIEERLRQSGRKPEDSTLEEMDALWNEAKGEERDTSLPAGEVARPRG
jgi:tetrapyrrole methylase family protein/MazG family protein/ATP diphosphatase